MQVNAHDKELVPFSVHSPSDVSIYMSAFLLTMTKKRPNLFFIFYLTAFTESEGERISDHCSVRCIRRLTDKQRREKPRSNRTTKTSEIVVL